MSRKVLLFAAGLWAAVGVSVAQAEPIFLSRQYARCTTCHYSPTGGGLLTPYGRSLSGQELSTTAAAEPSNQQGPGKEESFLWGVLGQKLGPVSVGVDMRPAYLHLSSPGFSQDMKMFMTADVLAAARIKGWTLYGEVGREPLATGAKIDSYEYWVGREIDHGLSFRAGRFLPAYGIRFADHTALTRANLGLDVYDQVYGLEVSQSWERQLLQVSVSPGRADSILHDDGRRAFTASGRFQMDLSPRTVLVVSGLFRDKARLVPQNGSGGLAFGIAPTSHLSIWTEADAQFQQGSPGAPSYTFLNETGFEVYRGLWLKISPQLRTELGDTSAGIFRLVFEANLLPRTHWNVDVSFYRDRERPSDVVSKTFLAQLHLYL